MENDIMGKKDEIRKLGAFVRDLMASPGLLEKKAKSIALIAEDGAFYVEFISGSGEVMKIHKRIVVVLGNDVEIISESNEQGELEVDFVEIPGMQIPTTDEMVHLEIEIYLPDAMLLMAMIKLFVEALSLNIEVHCPWINQRDLFPVWQKVLRMVFF